ncbi:MAG: trehalose-phosphatase [Chloroflexota bacterium]
MAEDGAAGRRPRRGCLPTELPNALEHVDDLAGAEGSRSLAVFLDYDGTLTPIVPNPDDAVLSESMRETIEQLAKRCTVAVISGRDLQDVRGKVGVDGIAYAGSHGFDIHYTALHQVGAGPDFGTRYLPALDRAEEKLRKSTAEIPGAAVERKRFAVAVHYRASAEEDEPRVEEAIDEVAASEPQLRRTGGKKVFELRPNVDWDKGSALIHLMEALGAQSDTVPVFIGDDVTDEDAFDAIHDSGIGVIVGDHGSATSARYRLNDTRETEQLLRELARRLEPPRT